MNSLTKAAFGLVTIPAAGTAVKAWYDHFHDKELAALAEARAIDPAVQAKWAPRMSRYPQAQEALEEMHGARDRARDAMGASHFGAVGIATAAIVGAIAVPGLRPFVTGLAVGGALLGAYHLADQLI